MVLLLVFLCRTLNKRILLDNFFKHLSTQHPFALTHQDAGKKSDKDIDHQSDNNELRPTDPFAIAATGKKKNVENTKKITKV